MLISHEVPLQLLPVSRMFNDYDYCLVHLLDKYPEYREYYSSCRANSRKLYLDNSVFELGTAFDFSLFVAAVRDLQPTVAIAPDALEDCDKTISLFERFSKQSLPANTAVMGVVQGKTYEELTTCYNYMKTHADIVGISFGYSYYLANDSWDIVSTRAERYARGRYALILRWIQEGIFSPKTPHHLLGCALPQEVYQYRTFDSIYSVDTSNPVVQGIFGIRYDERGEIHKKNTTKLAELLTLELSIDQFHDVLHNITTFRRFATYVAV